MNRLTGMCYQGPPSPHPSPPGEGERLNTPCRIGASQTFRTWPSGSPLPGERVRVRAENVQHTPVQNPCGTRLASKPAVSCCIAGFQTCRRFAWHKDVESRLGAHGARFCAPEVNLPSPNSEAEEDGRQFD